MSESRSRGTRDFSKYDAMDTQTLEEILRLDAESPEGSESDTELLLYVMGVLADRRHENNTGKTAQEAWESFQQNYAPEKARSEGKKSAGKGIRWLRRLTAAVAAVVLVVLLPLTAEAFSWKDVWNVVAKWAKETFSFVGSDVATVNEPVPDYDGECTSLQELLRKNKIDPSIVPTWIPDGFALGRIEKDVTPTQEIYRAFYSNDNKELKIRVQTFLGEEPDKIEINTELVEIYEFSGLQFYIFSNMNQIRAVWATDSYQCNISGTLTIEELKSMINSIGKG